MMKRVRDIGQIIRPDFITNILEALCRGTGLGRSTLTQQQHKSFRKTTLPKLAIDHYKYLIGQLGLKTKPLNVEMRLKQLFPAHCIKTLEHLDYDPNADADEFLRSMHNNLFIKTTLNDITTFTFKDYLLGEYCAGFTLATDLKNGSNLNLEALLNSRQFIIQHRFNYYYQPLLWFTAGHLKDSNTLHYYLDLITKPEYTHYGSTRSKFTINLLLRCLEEAQLEKHHLEPQHQRIIATLEGDFCKYAKTDPEAFAVIEATPTTYWRALWLHTQGHRNSYSFTDFETRILAPVSLAYPETLLPYIEKQVLESPSESLSQVYKDLIHLDIAPPPTEKIIQKINTKPTVSLTEILSTIGLYYPDQVMLKLRQLSAQKPKIRLSMDQQSCSLFSPDLFLEKRLEANIRLAAFNGYSAIAKKHNLPDVVQPLIEQILQLSYFECIQSEIIEQTEDDKLVDQLIAQANKIQSKNPWDYKPIYASAYKVKLNMIWQTQPLTEDKKIEFIQTLGKYLIVQSIMDYTEAEHLSAKLSSVASQYPNETIAAMTPLFEKTGTIFGSKIAINALVTLANQAPEAVLPILKNELLKANPRTDIYNSLLNLSAEQLAKLLPTISNQLDNINGLIYLMEIIELAHKLAINDIERDSAIKLLRKIRMHNNPFVSANALLTIRDIIGHRNNPGLLFMMEVDHALPERSATTFVTTLSNLIAFSDLSSIGPSLDRLKLSCFDKFVAANTIDVFDYLYYQIHHNNRLSLDERIIHLELLARFTSHQEKYKVYHIFRDLLLQNDSNLTDTAAKILIDNYPLELATRCWFELEAPSDKFTRELKYAYNQKQAVLSYDHDHLILHYDGDEIDINKVTHPEPFTYFSVYPCQFLYPIEPTKVVALSKDMLHFSYLRFMSRPDNIPTQNNRIIKETTDNDTPSLIEWIEEKAPNYCNSVAQLLINYEEYVNTLTNRLKI